MCEKNTDKNLKFDLKKFSLFAPHYSCGLKLIWESDSRPLNWQFSNRINNYRFRCKLHFSNLFYFILRRRMVTYEDTIDHFLKKLVRTVRESITLSSSLAPILESSCPTSLTSKKNLRFVTSKVPADCWYHLSWLSISDSIGNGLPSLLVQLHIASSLYELLLLSTPIKTASPYLGDLS